MTEICLCECSEDVQTCFCFCVGFLFVLSERLSSVVGHSKCGGVAGVGDQLAVQCDGKLSCVLIRRTPYRQKKLIGGNFLQPLCYRPVPSKVLVRRYLFSFKY